MKTIAQILQSVFQLMWDICLPIIINYFSCKIWNISIYSKEHDLREVWSKISLLLLFLILLNVIMIPCFIVTIISPNCFYDILIPPASVETSYPFIECVLFDRDEKCLQEEVQSSSTSYDPPFNYSYQCSDDLIIYYAPSMVYSCLLLTFIYPLSIIITIYVNKHYPENSILVKLVRLWYPGSIYRTFYNYNNSNNDNSEVSTQPTSLEENASDNHTHHHSQLLEHHVIYEASFEIVYFFSMIGSLLTFGLVFPLTAITIFIATIILWLTSKHLCDRFLVDIIKSNYILIIEIFNHECYGAINQIMIENAFWIILTFSSCFFSFFLFDILGDDVGFQSSYWIIIVTSLIPFYLYILELMYKYSFKYLRFEMCINKEQQQRHDIAHQQGQQRQEQQQMEQRSDMIEMTEVKSPLA